MKAQSTAGRDAGHQAPAWQLRTKFYFLSCIAAAGAASMFIWPVSRPIGIAVVLAVAVPLAIHVPAAPSLRTTPRKRLAMATTGYRPVAASHLDLSDESPTSRSFVAIVPDRTPAPAMPRDKRTDRARHLWTTSLILANGTTVCLLVTHLREPAPWAMTVLATIVAVLSIAVTLARKAQPSRLPAPEPEVSTIQEYCHSTTRSRIGSNARIKGSGEQGRSE
jgi:hypothetical protein